MQRKIMFAVLGTLAGLVAVWAVAFARPYQLHGSEITPPMAAPPIDLALFDGSTYDLQAASGSISLLFFGYTACPDVCPTTMADFKKIKSDLGPLAERVQFVFITVDPQRDTIQRTAEYAAGFDPQFIGLSGSQAELTPVWSAYGVYRQIQEGQSAVGYLVDHSSRIYLVDTHGDLRLTYVYGTPPEDIAADARHILRE